MMTENAVSKPTSLPGFKSLVLLWVISGLLGLLGPYLVSSIVESQYFVQWKQVGSVPPGTEKILSGTGSWILIRTSTGQVKGCNIEDAAECWIPAIDYGRTAQQCEYESPPFNSLAHPPKDVRDCVEVRGGFEYSYKEIYAIDQLGNIWLWSPPFTILTLESFFFAPFFTVVGLLIGSCIWFVRWIIRKRKINQEGNPVNISVAIIVTWILAVLPLFGVMAQISTFTEEMLRINLRDEKSPIYTAVAATSNAWLSTQAILKQTPVAPGPSKIEYDFALSCHLSKWQSQYPKETICSAPPALSVPRVDVIQNAPVDTNPEVEEIGIRLYMPSFVNYMDGTFTVGTIRPGDHFRTTLKCKVNLENCRLVVTATITQPRQYDNLLGSWQVGPDSLTTDIDIDLSRFTGDQAIIKFHISELERAQGQQTIFLAHPRIENP